VLAAALLTGCGGIKGLFKKKGDPNDGVPVAQLYEKGHAQMVQGDWTAAEMIY
jgi:outer membrane protein assembly factor BamD